MEKKEGGNSFRNLRVFLFDSLKNHSNLSLIILVAFNNDLSNGFPSPFVASTIYQGLIILDEVRIIWYQSKVLVSAIMSQHEHKEDQRGADPRLYVEALVGEMRRMMRVELEQVNERLDRVENANQGQP
ncbi:hypothetical protein TIFTF001_025243 [Ficus carica]|uniref:Uncharacterized protein n=1 Tax=Ficus carica TaxID=3494 RepID=A0AA88B188_FICCA|nr:hypothetical protein TIFTF001_025243 [Ficus carica]